jgi:hypothetical protein
VEAEIVVMEEGVTVERLQVASRIRERNGSKFSLEPLEETQHCPHLDFRPTKLVSSSDF